jgi:translation initiation factor 1
MDELRQRVTVRSLRDRSVAGSGADAESFSCVASWAGEVWSCRARGSGDTVEAMKPGSRVVYSTVDGDLRKTRDPGLRERRADGDRVQVRRELAGRRGKAVTTVSGVPVDDVGLKQLAGRLKKRCGVGGSVKNGVIEIQGDHREIVVQMLEAEGYRPVLAGG